MSRFDLPSFTLLLACAGGLIEAIFWGSAPAIFYIALGVAWMQGIYRACTGVWFNPETDRNGVVKRHRPISAEE